MIEKILFENYRKETSERSDEKNWAKKMLIEQTPFSFDSIEGCNQNTENFSTHLLERARVDINTGESQDKSKILKNIIDLEGASCLMGKINFAKHFGLELSYVLYCNETEEIFLFEIPSIDEINLVKYFGSYDEFSNWLNDIKGWKSKKGFREIGDLPEFDKELRKRKAPWPTNIDCFIAREDNNNPIAILEFQNAHKTDLMNHCNNEYFWGVTGFDDQRRWQSQEILRVQSGLPFFIIVWSDIHEGFQFKEIDKVILPLSESGSQFKQNKELLKNYIRGGKSEDTYKKICQKMRTFELRKQNGVLVEVMHEPPISIDEGTFPMIYYKEKIIKESDKLKLIEIFMEKLSSLSD